MRSSLRALFAVVLGGVVAGGCGSATAKITRTPTGLPRPTVVAVLPWDARDDFQRAVRDGCREGVSSEGISNVSSGHLVEVLAGRTAADLDDRAAAALGKELGASGVIVGSFSIGHFSSWFRVRLIRPETGVVEATVELEDGSPEEGAKRACSILLDRSNRSK